MRDWLERVWYGSGSGAALVPLSWLFGAIVAVRRAGFRRGWFAARRVGRPVVVVGNLTVGGSGKTPLAVWLATQLTVRGMRVGIVSRGYGGSASAPLRVAADSDPAVVGDEPVLLARRAGVPVVVARERAAGAALLAPEVDLILADDGLQHYALARDLEIAVVDGRRRFGNGRLLPAGPLREPVARLREADLVVVNGGDAAAGELRMDLVPGDVVALGAGERSALSAWVGRRVHAVAGIGDPARFFATLRAAGLDPVEHPHPDHAPLTAADVTFDDDLPVLMTEKDAAKCRTYAGPRHFWLEVSATFAPEHAARLLAAVLEVAHAGSRAPERCAGTRG